jgi:hypothetical protein
MALSPPEYHRGQLGEPRRLDLSEQIRDVEAAMPGSVPPQAPRRLLELALAADAVCPPGLVPGDGDMDEALEEVPLARRCRAPGLLERLVGCEVLAPLDELEAMLVLRLRP